MRQKIGKVMAEMIYTPSPTGKKFHKARCIDSGFVRGLMGPIGSGKSVTCVLDLLMIAMDQEPDRHGVRRTKFAIIRNTYRELLDTTVATFFTWVNKDSGHWSSLNMAFNLSQKLTDGTTMETEFLFRALDKPDDIKKLLSLEITAAWINEAREIAKAVVDMVQGRVGRYPPPVLGVEPTFFGVIMDTNPPDADHWWYYMLEENIASNHKLFKQPAGDSPEAENIKNLPRNYYKNMLSGKTPDWIKVYVKGQYGFVADGKPVYQEYNDALHYTDDEWVVEPGSLIYIGIDFGLTPAATFGQKTVSGRFVIFDELVTFNMGAVSFGKILKEHINGKYRSNVFEVYGDPSGEGRAQTDEETPFMVLAEQGINAWPTHTNDFTIRREVVADYLMRLDFTGKPAFQLTPGCPTLRKAMAGGYRYKRMQVSGEERFQDKPDKGKFSHVADAGQYLMLGACGDNNVIGGYAKKAIDYSQLNRGIR
jgi:hypothetical protein